MFWLVGSIGRDPDPPANTRSNGPLSITPSTPVFIHSDVQNEATNRMPLPEPLLLPEYPPQSSSGGTIFESNALAYDDPTPDQFHIEDQLSSTAPDHKHNFHDQEATRFSDPGSGGEEMTWLPVGSPPVRAKNAGSQRPDAGKRVMTQDEERKMRRTLPKRSQSPEPREETWVSVVPISISIQKHAGRLGISAFD